MSGHGNLVSPDARAAQHPALQTLALLQQGVLSRLIFKAQLPTQPRRSHAVETSSGWVFSGSFGRVTKAHHKETRVPFPYGKVGDVVGVEIDAVGFPTPMEIGQTGGRVAVHHAGIESLRLVCLGMLNDQDLLTAGVLCMQHNGLTVYSDMRGQSGYHSPRAAYVGWLSHVRPGWYDEDPWVWVVDLAAPSQSLTPAVRPTGARESCG